MADYYQCKKCGAMVLVGHDCPVCYLKEIMGGKR
jgi:RNA polymerase subunit RPABC4/transcription elongation factor Spt4